MYPCRYTNSTGVLSGTSSRSHVRTKDNRLGKTTEIGQFLEEDHGPYLDSHDG